MDLRKVANMYNGDILKPDGLSPARIEAMHSPINYGQQLKNAKVVENERQKLVRVDGDLEVTAEHPGVRRANCLSQLTSL
jgi:hypothetical protein